MSDMFDNKDIEGDTWIEENNFKNFGNYDNNHTMFELYALSCYFTMQTLTTVGYGDISIVSVSERVFCMLL